MDHIQTFLNFVHLDAGILLQKLFQRGWITTLVLGLVAGWVASRLVSGKKNGLLANLVVGVVGSWIGPHLFQLLGIQIAGYWGLFAEAIAGAVALILVVRMIF